MSSHMDLDLGPHHTPMETLAYAQHLASSLLSESSSIKAFRGRWIILHSRSHQLLISLSAISDLPCLKENDLLQNLLPTIVDTLQEGMELAKKCIDLDYGGKLLMQSNLDALASKIDLFLRDLSIITQSGILKETISGSNSHITRSSSAESTRETVALTQVCDIFARLKMCNTDSKQRALDSLITLLRESERIACLIAEEGDISFLIHLLDAGIPIVREKAADAISILAQVEKGRHAIMNEDVHAPLIRLLENGTPIAREKASEALLELTEMAESSLAIVASGGVQTLIQACRDAIPDARAMAAGCLRNLASNEKLWRCLTEEGSVPVLINMVRGENAAITVLAQEYAAEAIQNLASGDDRLRLLIARHGGLQCMLAYLSMAPSPRAQEIAIKALRNLSACITNARALVSAGYLNQLGTILSNGSSNMQQLAASQIHYLCSTSTNARKALREVGSFLKPLARMLEEGESSMEKEAAAQALATLLRSSSIRKEFYKEEKGIPLLVQLLDPGNESTGKWFPMTALMALARSGNCRRRIMSAGGRQHLEKLAEMEVAGAKKTLDKIRGNKLLNIFRKFRS